MIRYSYESDGKCCHRKTQLGKWHCCCLEQQAITDIGCGTYKCPFYKPQDCEDWLRLERNGLIHMIPPEEFSK